MNIGTKDLALALEAWAAGVIGFNTEAHEPTSLAEALPIVICEVKDDVRAAKSSNLPGLGQYEQTLVRARTAELMLLHHPEPSWTASQNLYDAVDELAVSITRDPTLGQRVHVASKYYEASYDPPEIQYQDGTRARFATFRMFVGELVKEV